MFNLARLLVLSRCDYTKARELLDRALVITERVHGSCHRDVAAILSKLATVSRKLGDDARVQELQQRLLTNQQYVNDNGRDPNSFHRSTLKCGLTMNSNPKSEDLAKARKLQEHALMIQERKYGPEHEKVGDVLEVLAQTCCQL